jgi:hypothetical protein
MQLVDAGQLVVKEHVPTGSLSRRERCKAPELIRELVPGRRILEVVQLQLANVAPLGGIVAIAKRQQSGTDHAHEIRR